MSTSVAKVGTPSDQLVPVNQSVEVTPVQPSPARDGTFAANHPSATREVVQRSTRPLAPVRRRRGRSIHWARVISEDTTTTCVMPNSPPCERGCPNSSLPRRLQFRQTPADEGADVGADEGTPVTEAYKVPFKITCKIDHVTIELKEMKRADSEEAVEGRKAALLKKGLSD